MIFILLAAYNEAANIGPLLIDLRAVDMGGRVTIVLVDDGSTDGTAQAAREHAGPLPLAIVPHAVNKGLGTALASGLAFIVPRLQETDIVITLDADCTHPVALMPKLIAGIRQGASVTIASRFVNGGAQCHLPLKRRVCSKAAEILLRILWPINGVHDYTCGYRAYAGTIIKQLADRHTPSIIRETGFAATLELLLKASTLTKRFTEIPFILDYSRKRGASKMRIMATIIHELRLIARCMTHTTAARRVP